MPHLDELVELLGVVYTALERLLIKGPLREVLDVAAPGLFGGGACVLHAHRPLLHQLHGLYAPSHIRTRKLSTPLSKCARRNGTLNAHKTRLRVLKMDSQLATEGLQQLQAGSCLFLQRAADVPQPLRHPFDKGEKRAGVEGELS